MIGRLFVVVALLLLAAPAAEAKAPPDLKVCGASGCVQIAQADAERLPLWHTEGAVAPSAPAPFFVFRYRWRAEDAYSTAYWIPARNAVRILRPSLAAWYRVGSADLSRYAATLEPFAPPRITAVTVGGRRVRAPATYARLLSAGRPTNVFPATTWLRVRYTTSAPTPWTDETANVRLSKTGAWVLRDDTVFAIPKRLAERARRGLPLAP